MPRRQNDGQQSEEPIRGRVGHGAAMHALFDAAVQAHFGGQQVMDHRRHERPAQNVAGHHGEDDGHGQRGEEIFGGAGNEHDGNENDADAKRGDERGHGDLLGAVENGLDEAFALVDVAVDVLDGDGGVVDEDAHGQGHPAEGHDVERLAKEAQDDDGDQDREGNGNDDDKRGTPGSQEQEDHEGGETGGDGGFLDDAFHRGPDEEGLVEERRDDDAGVRGGQQRWISGSSALTALTTSSVEALPFLRMEIRTPRWPSEWTMLVWTAKPSRTWAMSLT